jgi:hypothetical protein
LDKSSALKKEKILRSTSLGLEARALAGTSDKLARFVFSLLVDVRQ